MTRVELDLDPGVYDALRRRAERDGTTVDAFVTRLLASAVEPDAGRTPRELNLPSKHMGAKFPMDDWAKVKEFLAEELDEKYREQQNT